MQRIQGPSGVGHGSIMENMITVQMMILILGSLDKILLQGLSFLRGLSVGVQGAVIAKRSLQDGDRKILAGLNLRMLLYSTLLKRNLKIH
ncbi:hypothetical protein LWI29_015878 [Acer saccharum]|uniref:Uncharacterized protein n=1 Tax=Acer saccharum TaxID=4024 RepID=A0AA39SY47_ACESA|nr:hypothetical protein LWI29_015878 [Acer saccharum]